MDGDYLTPRAHREVWEGWRGLRVHELAGRGLPGAVLRHKFEDFPRGRVMADRAGVWFTILAYRKLHAQPRPARIADAFGLDPARCTVR